MPFMAQQQQMQQMQQQQLQQQMQQQQEQQQQQQIQQQQQMQKQQMHMQISGQPGTPQGSQQGQHQIHPHHLQLQQQPPQHIQQQQQQQQQPLTQQQQHMMMMLKIQEQAKNRLPLQQSGHPQRTLVNPSDPAQRMPVSQPGNMPVMINLQGHGGVPPSPEKARGMQPVVTSQLTAAPRRMPHPDIGHGTQGIAQEETLGTSNLQERASIEMVPPSGNAGQQNAVNQGPNSHLLKSAPSSVPQQPGASPQQQPQQAPMAGSHNLHFPNAPSASQSSRPKTPNRASPRPYHHSLTPTNRPPSTEPSEINLSPERLNASIAGLFPPKINIPLPPRQPNLTRGFDQQGLNPTTLKAIGQAPPSLTSLSNNNTSGNSSVQQGFTQASNAASTGVKQEKPTVGGQTKRASPGNNRRSSPASNRKTTTPSPGRQKWTKNSLTSIPNQQQMSGTQTVMASAASVLPSSIASVSSAGTLDSQHNLNPLQTLPSNSDTTRDIQGLAPQPDPRQTAHVERDQSALKVVNQRMPSQESKIQEPNLPPEQVSEEMHQHQNPQMQEHGSAVSASFRDAPTSLNQLLDNTGPSSLSTKSPKITPTVGGDRALVEHESQRNPSTSNSDSGLLLPTCELEQKSKIGSTASPNVIQTSSSSFQPSSGVSSVSSSLSVLTSSASNAGLHPNPSVSQSASTKPISSMPQTVLHRPTSSGSTQPSQITVFVTSNPISSASSTASAVPPAIVSTVLAVPTKSIRPSEVHSSAAAAQNRPPQFITGPVIFQVPSVSVPSSTNVVSQPVTVVGPIQVSANIQLTPAPVSGPTSTLSAPMATHSPVVSIATSQPGRAMIGQIQVQVPASPASSLSTVHPALQESTSDTTVSKISHIGQSSSSQPSSSTVLPSLQQPLASSPVCSSPGITSVAHRSPLLHPTTIAKNSPVQNALSKMSTPNSGDLHQLQQQTSSQSGKPIDTAPSQVVTNTTFQGITTPSSPLLTPTVVSSAPTIPQSSALILTVTSSASMQNPQVSTSTPKPSSSVITPSSAVVPPASTVSCLPPVTSMSAPSIPPPASVPPVSPAPPTGPTAGPTPLLPNVEPKTSTVMETNLPEPANTTAPAEDTPSLQGIDFFFLNKCAKSIINLIRNGYG